MITRILDADPWQARLRAALDYVSFDRQYQIDWLRWMCELVGVAAPTDEDCVALGHAAYRSITPRVRAAFPGVVAAIRVLWQQGNVLHTASGESSKDLDGYLQGMGVRACFDRLYGPDLLDTFKDGPRFYQRIFADAGIEPRNALVVDDNVLCQHICYVQSTICRPLPATVYHNDCHGIPNTGPGKRNLPSALNYSGTSGVWSNVLMCFVRRLQHDRQ